MNDDALAQAKAWCSDLGVVERDGSVFVNAAGGSVEIAAAEDGIEVRATVDVETSAPGGPPFPDVLAAFERSRPGLLEASLGDDGNVVVRYVVHGDGLSKHATLFAVAEVGKSVEAVRALTQDYRRQSSILADLEALAATPIVTEEQMAAVAASSVSPEPVASTPPPVQPAPVQPAPVQPAPAQPAPATGVPWTRSHVVPAGGMPAWDAADPNRAPIATLPAGVELQLVRTYGGWGLVQAANGWSGWVDASKLVVAP